MGSHMGLSVAPVCSERRWAPGGEARSMMGLSWLPDERKGN